MRIDAKILCCGITYVQKYFNLRNLYFVNDFALENLLGINFDMPKMHDMNI